MEFAAPPLFAKVSPVTTNLVVAAVEALNCRIPVVAPISARLTVAEPKAYELAMFSAVF
ncbi:MAG: hypothetical protein WDN28_13165 [Chthoniobacter sp.]